VYGHVEFIIIIESCESITWKVFIACLKNFAVGKQDSLESHAKVSVALDELASRDGACIFLDLIDQASLNWYAANSDGKLAAVFLLKWLESR
jgi:hypothetical protein